MNLTQFSEIFQITMYSLIGLVFAFVIIMLIYNKIKYGKFFEDDAEMEKTE